MKWRSDGALEYISRADHQIKIRGFRRKFSELYDTIGICCARRTTINAKW
ncbi:Dimodular nonribosomal peptide synthase [Streptococcus pneumoniae]|nr:Dimodular nonribosomal peptide synthase [Streptococcus pneumoniae]